jgi:RNA polymerase sigma factor (sigma-70 family)
MEEDLWLVERFETHRVRMRSVASRMLGSTSEADDALQEAWIRFSRSDTTGVENVGAWLTTVVSRVCLDILQQRRRRAVAPEVEITDLETSEGDTDPEDEVLMADSVGLALMVVLDRLGPSERVALVLHDVFGVPFEEVAPIIGRNVTATRQIASRARRRVRSGDGLRDTDRTRQARVVEAFITAARGGDLDALLTLLDPDVVLRADGTAVQLGAPGEVRGASEVAGFLKIARGAQPVLVDGWPAALWAPGGEPRVVLRFMVRADKVVAIDAVGDREVLGRMRLML